MSDDPQARAAHARHELRTPVNAILGYSELLLEDAGDEPAAFRADRPFRILGIDGLDEAIKAPIPDQEDTTMFLTFTIQPNKAGELRRQITIRTNLDKESATITVSGDVAP